MDGAIDELGGGAVPFPLPPLEGCEGEEEEEGGTMLDVLNFYSGGDLNLASYVMEHHADRGSSLFAALDAPPEDAPPLVPPGLSPPSTATTASPAHDRDEASADGKEERKRAANNEASKRYRARKRQRLETSERRIEVLEKEQAMLQLRYNDTLRQLGALHKSLALSHSYANQAHARLVAASAENEALRAEVTRLGGDAAAAAASRRAAPALGMAELRRLLPEDMHASVSRAAEDLGIAPRDFNLDTAHETLMGEMKEKLRDMTSVGTASVGDLLDKIYMCCMLRTAARRAVEDSADAGTAAAAPSPAAGAAEDVAQAATESSRSKADRMWRVVEGDLDLSADQLERLRETRARHRARLEPLAGDRARVVGRLAAFLEDRSHKWRQVRGASGPEELATVEPMLADLRGVIAAESRLLDSTLESLRAFLSPRQEALLTLRLAGHGGESLQAVLKAAWSG